MSEASAEEIRRWSEEVARDPESLAFVPLAEAYRRQGKLDAAHRLLLRGLGRHPSHVEGHAVLARVYLARDDREKAFDEWHAINELDEEHFEARRGLGFGYLDRDEPDAAVDHLEVAARLRPGDSAVREALELARERAEASSASGAEAAPATAGEEAPTGGVLEAGVEPRRLFEDQLESPDLHGIVLLDGDGLVVAGGLRGDRAERTDEVAAVLSGSGEEAMRTARHLDLGAWDGILLEMEETMAYLSPVEDGLLLVAARGDAPVGWLKRISRDAREAARRFLGAEDGGAA